MNLNAGGSVWRVVCSECRGTLGWEFDEGTHEMRIEMCPCGCKGENRKAAVAAGKVSMEPVSTKKVVVKGKGR